MEFIIGILMLILYVWIFCMIVGATVTVVGWAVVIGITGGFWVGVVKGIINYFTALIRSLRFEQY